MTKIPVLFKRTGLAAGIVWLALCATLLPTRAQDVVTLPLRVNGYVDVGQVVEGSSINNATLIPVENYFLSNVGISLVSETIVGEKLHLNVGVGGLFWYPINTTNPGVPSTNADARRIQFGPGLSEASFQYDFQKNLFLKFGFFGYKYNPDAQNLGEYLLRSQAYPGFLKTGGWSILNSAAYQSLGTQVRWNTFGGAWTHDFLLFSEFEYTPIFSMSPSYVSTVRVGKILEFGGGITFHHLIPVKPSEETPAGTAGHSENVYVEIPNMPALPGSVNYFGTPQQQRPVDAGSTLKGMENYITTLRDSVGNQIALARDAEGRAIYILDGDTLRPSQRKRLTYQGIKLMGRASFDPKPLLGLEEILNPGDLRLYAEMAVLGVADQPFYYENIANRMPVMIGFNFPTFNLLDALSLEVEYYRNPWPENVNATFENSWPIWTINPQGPDPLDFIEESEKNYDRDDWKWSVNTSRTLARGLKLYVQVANDHLRLRNEFAQPTFVPLTIDPTDWYYLVRLQWGI